MAQQGRTHVFQDLTANNLKYGVLKTLQDFIEAINVHIDAHNEDPAPFIWKVKARRTLDKVKRAEPPLKVYKLMDGVN